ncbi:PPE domain-containing protein [Allosaccharopolyspora coralli]|uniref:PPE domain-containing protein n=1 Tax=Allosaccharopolyspora coralli TaxID=2665642 RepID=A0A5Q3QDA8_9PSEU|nr:PPE domain-containing protein [Allosaccharopolyspora coralli]QGK71346.1 PPE domain-containing protein [Allosaccharopolyspora coralli]
MTNSGDHRWQGYSHPELYEQIHQGPGADASTDPVRRWSELTTALAEIDSDLASALIRAMDGWQGEAAETTRSGLRPLGEWAGEVQEAARVMRDRAEEQAEHVGKARAEMPPPVRLTAEDPGMAESLFTHLFSGQTDREAQEAAQDAAEQRAFDVMRTYESSTRANTTSLASFAAPPQVTVDAPAARPMPGGGVAQPAVTINWAPSVPATPPTGPGSAFGPSSAAARLGGLRAAPGLGTSGSSGSGSGSGRSGSGSAGGSAAGRAGSGGSGSAGGSGSGGSGRTASRAARDQSGHDDEPETDSPVTEDNGEGGGFFDAPRTSSRPVIGGEPG